MEQTIVKGTEGLVLHTSHSTWGENRYQAVTVTRTTKSRVFAKAAGEHAREQEFRLEDLREYGTGKRYGADLLIVDPAEIAKIRAQQAEQAARKSLEGRAMRAVSDLSGLFGGHGVRSRTEAEIDELCALRDRLAHLLKG